MPIYSFRTGIFSRGIYLYGTHSFTGHNGTTVVPEEYHFPCKEYAAKNFTLYEKDKALAMNWITQQEYDETVALRTESSPMQVIAKEEV